MDERLEKGYLNFLRRRCTENFISSDCRKAMGYDIDGACPRHSKRKEILKFKLAQGLTFPYEEHLEDGGYVLMNDLLPRSVSTLELATDQRHLRDMVANHPLNWQQTGFPNQISQLDDESEDELENESDIETRDEPYPDSEDSDISWYSCEHISVDRTRDIATLVTTDNNAIRAINTVNQSAVQGYINCVMINRDIRIDCKGLIYSGNSLSQGVAISKTLFNRIEGTLCPSGEATKVGTASSLSTLSSLGISKTLELEIPFNDGRTLRFQIKPQVIYDLSDSVNIGSNFLKETQANLTFSAAGIILAFPVSHPQIKSEKKKLSAKGREASDCGFYSNSLTRQLFNRNSQIISRDRKPLQLQLVKAVRQQIPREENITCKKACVIDVETI